MTQAKVVTAALPGSQQPLVDVHDLALLDLDGVVYVGPDAVPGAAAAVSAARASGMRIGYVTNNASRPPEDVAEHLNRLGISSDVAEVVTSAQVAATILARRLPPGSPVLVVGGVGLRLALEEEGLRPVASMSETPVAVVQGFGPDVGWKLLAEGARAVRAGLLWVATNLDLTIPTRYGPAPGNGALVRAVAEAGGRPPDVVAGKPQPEVFLEAARRYGSQRPVVVGDRLDTDLQGARAAGMPGLAVLTGIVTVSGLLAASPRERPTHIGRDICALLEAHPAVDVTSTGEGTRAACRDARVEVVAGVLSVLDPGRDPLDVVRAAAAAAWAAHDADGVRVDPAPVLAALQSLEPGLVWAR